MTSSQTFLTGDRNTELRPLVLSFSQHVTRLLCSDVTRHSVVHALYDPVLMPVPAALMLDIAHMLSECEVSNRCVLNRHITSHHITSPRSSQLGHQYLPYVLLPVGTALFYGGSLVCSHVAPSLTQCMHAYLHVHGVMGLEIGGVAVPQVLWQQVHAPDSPSACTSYVAVCDVLLTVHRL